LTSAFRERYLAAERFDVLLTVDRNLEYQH